MAAIAAPPLRVIGPRYLADEDDPLDLIEEIAEYRAEGANWISTSRHFEMDERTIRRLIRKNNAVYRKHLAFYRREHIHDTAMESLVALRTRLRSQDDKTAIAAAAGTVKFYCTLIRHLSKHIRKGDPAVLPMGDMDEDVFLQLFNASMQDRAEEQAEEQARKQAENGDEEGPEGAGGVQGPDDGGASSAHGAGSLAGDNAVGDSTASPGWDNRGTTRNRRRTVGVPFGDGTEM